MKTTNINRIEEVITQIQLLLPQCRELVSSSDYYDGMYSMDDACFKDAEEVEREIKEIESGIESYLTSLYCDSPNGLRMFWRY